MSYDLFLSYSRNDNSKKRVSQLKKTIETDYYNFSGEKLRCFFDTAEIKSMDDWRHRILQGLKDSHLFLLILSPNYLSSPYCEWEITEYLKYEYSRVIEGGIAQIYFLEIPGIDEPDFTDKSSDWFKKISHRQKLDLRPWYEEGEHALKRRDVKRKLKELNESLFENLSRLHSAEKSPGNLPAPNKRFVGRESEMKKLHEETGLGKFGVITAVHGMGGLGKTSIAIQYAYAYSHFYPGGRWQIGCEGKTSLAGVLRELDTALDIYLTDEEKKDDKLAAQRILRELEKRAIQGAKAVNRKKSTKKKISPVTLLILDNVDKAQLIQSPETDILTGKKWLKLLVTTRMGEEDIGYDNERQSLITIDELPQEDALKLIESYQRGGVFPNEKESEAAREIAKLLDGFTLAVEMTAIYLRDTNYRVTCQDFLKLLKSKGGLAGAELAAKQSKTSISHEKHVSLTLAPTLEKLSEEEKLVLAYASQLPPDNIPIPWLKDLVKEEYPKLGKNAKPGMDDRWLSLVNRLISLRIFQVVEVHENMPRIVRIHRLVGERLNRVTENKFNYLIGYLKKKSNEIERNWFVEPIFWELISMKYSCLHFMLRKIDLENIANNISFSLFYIGKYDDAKKILHYSINKYINFKNENQLKILASSFSNLSIIELKYGNLEKAKKLLYNCLKISKKIILEKGLVLTYYSNLSMIEYELGKFNVARRLILKVIKIKNSSNIKKYDIATSYTNLAIIDSGIGVNLDNCKKLLIKAIELENKKKKKNIYLIARRYSSLAHAEENLKNFTKAKYYIKKTLKIYKTILPTDSDDIAQVLIMLGSIERNIKKYNDARNYLNQGIKTFENKYKGNHPILINCYSIYGLLERDLGNLRQALNFMNKALKLAQKKYKNNHPIFGKLYLRFFLILMDMKNFKAAKLANRNASHIFKSFPNKSKFKIECSINNKKLMKLPLVIP